MRPLGLVSSLAVIALGGATACAAELRLTSVAFPLDGSMPARLTCSGADRSPPLVWTDPPVATKSFALVVEDPDAPAGIWTHWVAYDFPANTRALPEGMPADERLSDGAAQGVNDFRKVGWGGPCPPPGRVHHYVFRLLALDAKTDLPPRASRTALLAAARGHVLGEARLVGTFGRE